MLRDHTGPVDEYVPRGDAKGCVLVVSDYRLLNVAHATALRTAGYRVYTAVTCTDVPRVFETFEVPHVDLLVFASLVHGWHHLEAEARPEEMPSSSDEQWQTRNILRVVEIVSARQGDRPKIIVATDLIKHDCYDVTADALTAVGLKFETYSPSNPPSLVRFLE